MEEQSYVVLLLHAVVVVVVVVFGCGVVISDIDLKETPEEEE